MNNDLQRMMELEKVDREFTRLTEEVAALPKRVAEIEHQLADHKSAVEKAKTALKDNESGRRKLEGDIKTFQGKIAKYRSQQSSVKTNEEYRALTHEVEFAEKEIRNCEDKILELMVSLESAEKAVKVAEADLKTEAVAVEKEKTEARSRTAEDEKLLKGLGEQRGQLRTGVTESSLAHYDRVLGRRKTALAEARDSKCQACFVMVRPQTWEELKTNEHIITCFTCGRILYFDPSHMPPVPPDPPSKKKKKARPVAAEAADAVESGPAGGSDVQAEAEAKNPETTPTQ